MDRKRCLQVALSIEQPAVKERRLVCISRRILVESAIDSRLTAHFLQLTV